MTAADIRACLALRWPDSEYLSIEEAPQASDRSGRKIDLFVVSLWRSRGLERDAVEIKVSLSDWKRERDHAAKADFWWRHSHRFWVAVPTDLAAKIHDEVPPTWGLLACDPGAVPKVVIKPARREPEPLTWSTTIGVLRAAANCSTNIIHRAEMRGREQGRQDGLRQAEQKGPDGYAKEELERLRRRVAAFEEASGVEIGNEWDAGQVGTAVALIRQEFYDPGRTLAGIGRAADDAERLAKRITDEARNAKRLAKLITDCAATVRVEL